MSNLADQNQPHASRTPLPSPSTSVEKPAGNKPGEFSKVVALDSRMTKARPAPLTYLPPFEGLLRKIKTTRDAGFYFYMRNLESASGSEVTIGGRKLIMLGSNNYLGLTTHPRVKRAAIRAIKKYGTGAGGVRILSGTYRLHEELEEKLAELKRTAAAVVYSAGYVTNLAATTILSELGYLLINDERNHASIIDGCKARRTHVCFYKHNNMQHLEEVLRQDKGDEERERYIIADGIFSMDGDIADLPQILTLARRHGAKVYIDDAHATGVLGTNGRGTSEYYGVEGQVDIVVGTLSKALGAVGGFVAGSKDLVTYLKHASRAFVFGSALPPSVAATAIASLDVLQKEPEHLARLRNNILKVRAGLKDIGFSIFGDDQTPIIPVIVGEETLAYHLTKILDEAGVFVNPVAHPAVKPKEARIRVSVNSLLTVQQIGKALVAFKRAGQSLGLI